MAIAYEVVFRSQPEEFACAVERVEGALPSGLRGTLLRNGPGYQQLGPDPLNFYDGLGCVSGVGFRDGRAFLRSRHVRTRRYAADVGAGRQTARMVFTNKPGWLGNVGKLPADPNQHDVYTWGGRIWATGSGGHCGLDPKTFDTVAVGERWGAPASHQAGLMTRVDPARGRLCAYTVKQGLTSPDRIHFVELDPELRVVARAEAGLRGPSTLVHDIAVTERFHVVCQMPVKLHPLAALAGRKPVWNCLEWLKEPPVVTLVPRAGGGSIDVPLPAGGIQVLFHFVNAFDDGGRWCSTRWAG